MRTQSKFAGGLLAFSLVMAVLRTFIVITNMEQHLLSKSQYYVSESAHSTVFLVITLLFIAVIAVSSLKIGKKSFVSCDKKSFAAVVSSIVLAFALLAASGVYILNYLGNSSEAKPTVIGIIVSALGVGSALVFLFSGVLGEKIIRYRGFMGFVSLMPIGFYCVRLLGDFIRTGAEPFVSSGAYNILGLCFALLFFLCEGKSYVSDCSGGLFSLFGGLAVYFLLVYSVPDVVLHCFGCLPFDYYTVFSVANIAAAVYICSRIVLLENPQAE